MSATYDPTTDAGTVRLLSADTDITDPIFSDAEITAFLRINGSDVRLAAAQAIDVIATNEAYVQKVMTTLMLTTNGAQTAAALRLQAAGLREQVSQGIGDYEDSFDIAETVNNTFSYRERLLNLRMREGA